MAGHKVFPPKCRLYFVCCRWFCFLNSLWSKICFYFDPETNKWPLHKVLVFWKLLYVKHNYISLRNITFFLNQTKNIYLTVTQLRAGYELIYITNEAVGNSLDFFGWKLLKSWHFLYRRGREKIFSHLQNFSTRNSPSVFPYLVKLNDNGSYHGLREPITKLENHYPALKIY